MSATGNGTPDNSSDDDSKMQRFELYIKASAIDRETKGSCPICQQFFMITCLLGENQDDIDFKVFTVQAECPPKNFAVCWSKKYPVVMVNSGHNKFGQDISGMMYDTFEDLETFFEGINKECPELKRKNAPNQAAMHVVENVYKHFNHFIAGQTDRSLLSQLKKLNEYLESQDTRFLVDNVLSFSDCHLLPRLQHIRVAGRHYRKFDIPKEYTYIWKYMQNAYNQDAFRSTIPSDQDIICHYEKKVPAQYQTPFINNKLKKFTYTLEVPEDCRQKLDATKQEQVRDDEEYIPVPAATEEKPSTDAHDHTPSCTDETGPPHDHSHDGHAHDGHSHDGHSHDGHSHDGHAHDGHSHDGHAHEDHSHDGHSHIDFHKHSTGDHDSCVTEIMASQPDGSSEDEPASTNGTADDANFEKIKDVVSQITENIDGLDVGPAQ